MKVKCIQKFRGKHNKIIGYRLVDDKGNVKDVKAEKLKQVIAAGKLSVSNLTLTADGRLVTTSEKDTKSEAASKAKTVKSKNKVNITRSKLVEAIKSGYNTFLKDICSNESLTIDFEDVLYPLDTSLYESIGMKLIKADDDLLKSFNQEGSFSLSDLQLDISDRRVYDQLVEIVNDEYIQGDYQFNDFINNLANSIRNKYNKAQLTYGARLADMFGEED